MVTFLHPWALWIGVAAATMPVLIHWWTRPRPVRFPLSTLRFVREAVRQQRTWRRLRDFVLLALRTLAVLLIALAVARPQWREPLQVSDLQGGDTIRVVLLDVSQSMAARAGAVEHIQRARTIAANYLRYRPGLAANLVLAGARPYGVFDGPSTNFEALRDELARCRALPERSDVNRAVDMAARWLAPASDNDRRRRELIVISDFQRSNWSKVDFSPLPGDTNIQFESTAPAEPPPNVAILGVQGRASRAGAQLDVEIGNETSATRKIAVDVTVGDATHRLTGACPPGRRTTLTEEIRSCPSGWWPGEARLAGVDDALPNDNVCPFVLHVRPRPTYILMTRQPRGRRATSSLFLECALAPAAGKERRQGGDASPRVIRVDPVALDSSVVASGDLIVLDHPGKLGDEAVKLLAALLRRGRPLLYVAADPIDATNLKRLREASGGSLQMPVEFTPPPAGHARRDLVLTSVQRESPPFEIFGDHLTSTLDQLRFAGGLGSRRLETGVDADVLGRYNDGSAAIVLTSSDAGALAVLNADLAASTLPKTAAFVPLLTELVEQLLDRHRATTRALSGEPLVAQLPAEAGPAHGLWTVGPSGVDGGRCGQLVDEAAGSVWRWAAAGQPGVYCVQRGDATVFAMAVNIPEEESQLDALTPDVLTGRMAAGRMAAYRGVADEDRRRDDSWKWFVLACVGCVMGEMGALIVFRT
ncbi:MAG: BatA and WFA domain-containing protein [Thermoguttaceae bacterium]